MQQVYRRLGVAYVSQTTAWEVSIMDDVTMSKVALLCGGWSDEREVSLASGKECAEAIKQAGFSQVDVLDVASPDFVRAIADGGYDVAFVALHGRYGEDGCVQGFLELLGIPYTFSGVLASAIASDKAKAKDIYREHGIPTPKDIVLYADESLQVDVVVEALGLPVFVKPVSNGSSYGITRVTQADQLPAAVTEAFHFGGRVLVEQAVSGTEITVPVFGNDHPDALPAVEIRYDAGFYDLASKYEDPAKHHVIPPELPQTTVTRAQELACRAHQALGCSGASRSDFIVTDDGTPYMLETNVVPGMTASSLMPDAARRAGMGFSELCRRLVELALERGARGSEPKGADEDADAAGENGVA